MRVFPSGTLGQEREVVQQLQEGLVDFMVSGTAIWGSVAPEAAGLRLPVPVARLGPRARASSTGAVGRDAADYLEGAVGMRPLAWGDSFGFRQVVTRSRDVTEPGQLAGLKIRTIQSAIYVKAVELMGASPTPMAFGEVYTSLQTGVIDGYEHDASTTLQQRFFEVARYMARTRHIAGVLGLWASTVGLARLPAGRPRQARGGGARGRAAQRARAERRTRRRPTALAGRGHDDPRHRPRAVPGRGRAAVAARGARARRRPGSWHRGRARRLDGRRASKRPTRAAGVAALVVAQAASSASRSSAATCCASPIPWTEEIARLLLVLADVRRRHPRAAGTPSTRASPRSCGCSRPTRRAAVDRGLRLVLLRLLRVPGRAGLAARRLERRRAAARERPVGRLDLR